MLCLLRLLRLFGTEEMNDQKYQERNTDIAKDGIDSAEDLGKPQQARRPGQHGNCQQHRVFVGRGLSGIIWKGLQMKMDNE